MKHSERHGLSKFGLHFERYNLLCANSRSFGVICRAAAISCELTGQNPEELERRTPE